MYKVFCDDQLLYLPGDHELVIFNTKLELADNKSGSFAVSYTHLTLPTILLV